MAFRVGQKVVCVDTTSAGLGQRWPSDYLKLGNIYTIRWIGECPYEAWRYLGPCIRLLEVIRPKDSTNPEWNDMPFAQARFRPIVERKTDISIFTRMLNPSKQGVDA
jgi:hypothetical protein